MGAAGVPFKEEILSQRLFKKLFSVFSLMVTIQV